MLRTVLRKMLKTRWMVLCLLIGVLIAASMLSSIPQYTGGIIQKVLTKDLENYQTTNNVYPGTYYVKAEFNTQGASSYSGMHSLDAKINDFYHSINLPAAAQTRILTNSNFSLLTQSGNQGNVNLQTMTGFNSHVKMIDGRFPAAAMSGGAYEVAVSKDALNGYGISIGGTYTLQSVDLQSMSLFGDSGGSGNKTTKKLVKVVGVFEPKSASDAYWYNGDATLSASLIMNESLFLKDFGGKSNFNLTECDWYTAFDYHRITLHNIGAVAAAFNQQKSVYGSRVDSVDIPALSILNTYNTRQQQLQTLLWVLEVPVILMLVFYLFMVAQLIIEEEKNEISVLKSRGASRLQIFKSYLYEGLMLGGFAFIFGPLLGLIISSLLGSSNGFLEFVSRTALPITLDYTAFLYALIAIGIFIVTILVPAFFASKTSIVMYKQESHGKKKPPFWQRYFLDFVLIAIAGYGIYNYHVRQELTSASTSGGVYLIDPLLMLISTLFILGTGLLFVRIYPFIIRFVFWAGKKLWRPSAYASLLYVSRSGGMDRFLIIFLIFTVSVGIFNATAARTINTNAEEKILYADGADIAVSPYFQSTSQTTDSSGASTTSYIEPDFNSYTKLSGVDTATKVLISNRPTINLNANKSGQQNLMGYGSRSSGGSTDTNNNTVINYMGIIPSEFGHVAWFKPSLLPYHWYNYLNILTQHPQALLLSTTFQADYGIKVGSEVDLDFGNGSIMRGIAYAFIDYWPTLNTKAVVDGAQQKYFVVGNLDYFQSQMPMQPYQIWIKKSANATSQQIYNDIKKKNLQITSLTDSSQDIVKMKNDPVLQGVNGSLTLSFLVTMVIAAVGFLIYWIMSIRSRTLQFGILRAMGLTFRELIGMLAIEQFLVSVISILMGIVIGTASSAIFVPMLQVAFNSSNQVPPFEAVAFASDYGKIIAIMAVILIGGISVLGALVKKIRIDQALKLGED